VLANRYTEKRLGSLWLGEYCEFLAVVGGEGFGADLDASRSLAEGGFVRGEGGVVHRAGCSGGVREGKDS
jgi:hypothetical protein